MLLSAFVQVTGRREADFYYTPVIKAFRAFWVIWVKALQRERLFELNESQTILRFENNGGSSRSSRL
jgi:hypothetical protein